MVPGHLPEDFGTQLAIAQDRDVRAWVRKVDGLYVFCRKCQVAIPAAKYDDHARTVHPKLR